MKRVHGVALVCLLTLGWAQVQAQQAKKANDADAYNGFSILADGGVVVEGELFDSMEAYQTSDKFRLEGRRCKTEVNRTSSLLVPEAASDCTNSQTVIKGEYWPADILNIPVVFHVITDTDGTGDISDALIQSQVDILNEDFLAINGTPGSQGFDTRIQFELAGITRTANRQWFNDRRESQYKGQLGWDQDKYLNIYTNTAGGYLGYAYLPDGSAGNVYDGVVLLHSVVGRNPPNAGIYNMGRTATHEVGHYLGLQHTFDGGCGSASAPYTSGDLIADTPPESTQHFDCVPSNTCNTPDPIENYMDYTPDSCMTEFTAEQGNRMVCSILNYRPGLPGDGGTNPGGFDLSASPYKVRGVQHVDLSWSGGPGGNVDIIRDGSVIATVSDSGSYTDNLGVKGSGSYTYTVCEAGASNCSNTVNVSF